MTRHVLFLVAAGCMITGLSSALSAQPLSTSGYARATVNSGYGAIGPGTSMGPGVSLGLRQHLLTLAPKDAPEPLAFLLKVGDRWSVAVDGFGQVGVEYRSGSWIVGGGPLLRWDMLPADFPVRPYFIVASVGAYISDLGRDGPEFNLGIGNGLGIDVPIGHTSLSLEMRVVGLLANDGASIPVTLGYSF